MSHTPRVFITQDQIGSGRDAIGANPPAVSSKLNPGDVIPLSSSDAHHLTRVLRLPAGADIIALSPCGAIYECTLTDERSLTVKAPVAQDNYQPLLRSLTFSILKGDHNDLICEKVTEIGVSHLVGYVAQRSVVRVASEHDCDRKLERWRRIVEGATKQSRQARPPTIYLARTSDELAKILRSIRVEGERSLLCSLAPSARVLREIEPPREGVHLATGPEGDFSGPEEELFVDSGFERISLGQTVLRAETAAIVGAAAINALWGPLEVSKV